VKNFVSAFFSNYVQPIATRLIDLACEDNEFIDGSKRGIPGRIQGSGTLAGAVFQGHQEMKDCLLIGIGQLLEQFQSLSDGCVAHGDSVTTESVKHKVGRMLASICTSR
jgi:hypothetical protein